MWMTRASSLVALAFAARGAKFPASWFDIPLVREAPAEALPSVSIVVPARDEERSIERCVRSLCTQRFVDAEVIVVDDRSTDRTSEILARLADEYSNLRIVTGEPLPDGWVGKPWALVQGERIARGAWLLFTDADSVHAPEGTASALAFARLIDVDAVTIVTHQELGTLAERATLPFILGMIFYASGTLEQLNDPMQPERALANGQYILVRRDAYDALGGHTALRAELVEDVAFARRIKVDGRFRLAIGGGSKLASVRMYQSLPEIWNGFTKNLFIGADGNVGVLFLGIAFTAALAAPPLLAARAIARRRWLEALEATTATALLVIASRRGIAMVGLPPSTAPLAFFGSAFFGAVALNSALCVASGRGVSWRGRRYSGRPQRQADLNAPQ